MKYSIFIVFIISCTTAWSQSDVAEIRNQRRAQNDAITAQDADAVAEYWTDNIQVTISSGTHLDGKEAYKAAFESVFQNIPGINFVRSPHQIKIAENSEIASEQGIWTGHYPGQEVTMRSGTYLAYWRLVDGDWLISAELFVPLEESP